MSVYPGWPNSGAFRVEIYEGVTDVNGQFTVVYSKQFNAVPHVNPQCQPGANAVTRCRVISRDVNGFAVQTETNPGLSVVSLTVLGLATTPVAGVPVSVMVVGN